MEIKKFPLTWEEIEAMPTGVEKCRMLLAYASEAMCFGEDCKAARAFSDAIVQVSWKNPGDNAPLLEEAYKGLCALSLSPNECAFEIASQASGDYHSFLEENQQK